MKTIAIKYQVGELKKNFDIIRPLKSRDIKYTTRSDRGYIPSLKEYNKTTYNMLIDHLTVNKNILEYESWLEHDFYLLLDHDPHCIDIQTQPVELKYKDMNEKTTYKSTNILRNKRQLAISQGRCASF